MKRYVFLLLTGVLGLFSFWIFRQGTSALGKLEGAGKNISAVCGAGVSSGEAREFLKETEEDSEGEDLSPVFWKECEGARARSGLTGKSASIRLICAAGNTELLFPGGNVLAAGDTKGCLLDRETAGKLFGSGAVTGQVLTLEGENYEIRGILEGQSGTAVIQKTEDMEFDTVTVSAGGRRQEEVRELLEGRYGIQGILVEWNLLYGMAKLLLLLLPTSVLAAVLIRIRRNGREASGKGEKIFWSVCFWAGMLGGLCWTAVQIRLPSDMIPSTWSDFGFWANLWEEKAQAVSFLLEMKKRAPEIPYINAFYQCVISGFLSLLLYFPALICYTYFDRLQSGDEKKSET